MFVDSEDRNAPLLISYGFLIKKLWAMRLHRQPTPNPSQEGNTVASPQKTYP